MSIKMKYTLDIRVPGMLLLLTLGILTVTVTEYLQSHLTETYRKQLETEAQRDLAVIRSNLEAQIYSDIYYANSLATLVSANPQSTPEQWEKIAIELFFRSTNLRNIGIAPNDIIQFVYPVEGNEKALGLNFRTVPNQWRTVEIARKTKSIFIAGPVELVQGGLGLIARNPIFTNPPHNTEYWGTCSVVLDVHSLFYKSGIPQLEEKYQFAIRGVDGKGQSGDVFYGDESVFDNIAAAEAVNLPSGSWYMAVSSLGLELGQPWYFRYAARLIGYPTLLIITGLFSLIYLLYRVAHTHSLQDELTKLPNRRYFLYSLEQAIGEFEKQRSQFTLMNLDLDNFKEINDTYGHTAGDQVLREVAKRIKNSLRRSDLVARVGGDEFLILLPRLTQEEKVAELITNIKNAIKEQPIRTDKGTISVGTSIGYATYNSGAISVDELLHAADINMYQDKKVS